MPSDLDADLLPAGPHRRRLFAVGAEAANRTADGGAGEGDEVTAGAELRIVQRVVPDLAGPFPRVASESGGDEVEGVVGDPGVGVYPTVVGGGLHAIVHVGEL